MPKYCGEEVFVEHWFDNTAIIHYKGTRKTVARRALTNADGRTYDQITVERGTPPDVLADKALSKAAQREGIGQKRKGKHKPVVSDVTL